MKKSLLVVLLAVTTALAFAQQSFNNNTFRGVGLTPAQWQSVKQTQAQYHHNGGARANTVAEINYALADDSLGHVAGDSLKAFQWELNKRFAVDSFHNYDLRWAYSAYDSIVNYPSLARIATPTVAYTLDSIVIPIRHNKTSAAGVNDTLVVVEYARTAGSTPTINAAGVITNTILHADTFVLTSSFSATTFAGAIVRPNISIAAGQHFGVAVYFSGPTANDTLDVIATYRNKCANACVAYPSFISGNSFFNLILFTATNTSLGGVLSNTTAPYYDCNSNGTRDASNCEYFYIQDFDFSAFVTIPSAPVAAPVADFSGTPTTLTQGGSVNFTDLSTNTPTSWSWSFPGGTPSTSTAQNPSVVYSTPGAYNVSLTATNSIGSNTKTKTAYIVVNARGSNTFVQCDTLANFSATDSIGIYNINNTTNGTFGYLAGNNNYGDQAKAEYFTNANVGTPVSGALLLFGKAVYGTGHGNDSVSINLWNNNGTGGAPGTILSTKKLAISSIAADVTAGRFTAVTFANSPNPTGNFYVGVTLPTTTGDTVALYTTLSGQVTTGHGWELQSNGTWYAYSDSVNSWNYQLDNIIAYIQCVTLPCPTIIATFTPTSAVCTAANGTIVAAGTGGVAPFTYSWGTSPVQTGATASNLHAGTYTVTITDANGCTGSSNGTITASSGTLSATIANTPAICTAINGTATVTPSNGTAPYTYSWNNGRTTAAITGLATGTYTVTVGDANGCTLTQSTTVTASTGNLTATATTTNATCNTSNGSATAVPTGGTPNYTYTWTTTPAQTTATASNLAAGNYTVIVTDANGCSTTAQATVISPASPSPAITVNNNVSCFGGNNGSATVNVTGGTGALTYHWGNNANGTTASGLSAGLIGVTVTDQSGCTGTASANITQPSAALSVTISGSTNPSCANGSNGTITAVASGGTSAYSYSWNSTPAQTTATATGLTAGTYTVTVTDANSCTTTKVASITNPTNGVSVTVAAGLTSACGVADGKLIALVSGGNSASYTYVWSTTPVQTTDTARNLAGGNYTVTVTDAGRCTTTTTGVVREPGAQTVTATPTNVTCFGASTGSIALTVSGGSGNFTYTWSPNVGNAATVSNLAAGTYNVTVHDNTSGCNGLATATITQPSQIVISFTNTNVTCNGGNNGVASANVTGGTGNYTYQWLTTPIQIASAVTGLSAGNYILNVKDNANCQVSKTDTITQPTAIVGNITPTPITCNGLNNGIATVSATGGAGNYNYTWSTSPTQHGTSATGLAPGSYTVTITDGSNCSSTQSVTFIQPALLSVTATKTNATCFGLSNGTASATATGGTGNIGYSWTNSGASANITGLAAGNYTVTATDASGCTASTSVTISQPAAITVTAVGTNVTCNGARTGTATAQVSGGVAPLHYAWNSSPAQITDTATGLGAGAYIVTVTDANNCSATATTNVTQGAAISIVATTANNSCHGDSTGKVTLTISGGASPYGFGWSNGSSSQNLTGLASGQYSVTVTDNAGCTATQGPNVVNQPTALSIIVSATNETSQGAGGTATATVNGGTGALSYNWSNGGTTAQLTNLAAGTYHVTATDVNGCSITDSAVVQRFTGIANIGNDVKFGLSPNPSTGVVIVDLQMPKTATVTIEWYNTLGDRMSIDQFVNTAAVNKSFDFSANAAGIYYARITFGNESVTRKVVITH